jgi:hypothetical protein
MAMKKCIGCGQSFQPRAQTPQQDYCNATECQRERRRRWQQIKRQSDPDYQENQIRAQQAWNERNPDYWREYRHSHPEYADRNRAQQRKRKAVKKSGQVAKMDVSDPILALPSGIFHMSQIAAPGIAKMDASVPEFSLPSGIYHLSLAAAGAIAKIDVWIVEITAHDCQCMAVVKIAKRGRDR